ncbi:MAG TPA: hypothetical protein VGJ65_20610 [Albitalea sp.]|jgi:hypothetical protein
MYLVAIAWMYVVLMMAVAEAMHPDGSVLGAIFTFLLYGALPLSIVMYLLFTPARRRKRRAAEADSTPSTSSASPSTSSGQAGASTSSAAQPDGGDHAPGDAVAPERKEP